MGKGRCGWFHTTNASVSREYEKKRDCVGLTSLNLLCKNGSCRLGGDGAVFSEYWKEDGKENG